MSRPPAAPKFRTAFEPRYGEAVELAPGICRVVAENPSPFTFHGTNSYVLGQGRSVAVIDPGPALDSHFEALERAIGGARGQPYRRHPHPCRSFAAGRAAEGGDGRADLRRGPRTAPPGRCTWAR